MKRISISRIAVLALSAGVLMPSAAWAYVGPGAGFAFAGSLFFLLGAIALALGTILMFPLRLAWQGLKRKRKGTGSAKAGRVVVMGFDGLDPGLASQWMDEGRMPNLARMRDEGHFSPLATTFPSISPVAWSSFMTGCTPARHNIFDFLARDKRTYLPDLSSAQISAPKKVLKLGKYRIPLEKPGIKLLRKGKTFWATLADHGIFSAILRVPITFPVDEFDGVQLAAMCAPDLKGTQGSFTAFSTVEPDPETMGGVRVRVERTGNKVTGHIPGPENTMVEGGGELRIAFEITIEDDGVQFDLDSGESFRIKPGEYSDWIRLSYSVGMGQKVHGIARFLVTSTDPDFSFYMTPINIDPENPALPISHPLVYSIYLSKALGSFATLGLAEDTWALNERVINEEQFLEQALAIHEERIKMFWSELEKVKKGLMVCVFDATDRIQHMFYRFMEDDHPAARGFDREKYRHVVRDVYEQADALVGEARAKLDDDDVLIVMSDHGFTSFRRGLNVNTWLMDNGYLVLKDGKEEGGDWFVDVDWSKTRAFGLGLAGMYLNLKGREAKGIVEPGEEATALKREIIEKMNNLKDTDGTDVVNEVFDTDEIYLGPYKENAPDLLIGYHKGYRVSWESVTGKITKDAIVDNTKAWGGDHCIDPRLVPGSLFSTTKIGRKNPRIIDLAPTILDLFGVPTPKMMDGVSLLTSAKTNGVTDASMEDATATPAT